MAEAHWVVFSTVLINIIALVSPEKCYVTEGHYRDCEYGCCGTYNTECCSNVAQVVWIIFACLCAMSVIVFVICCCIKTSSKPKRIIVPNREGTAYSCRDGECLYFHSGLHPTIQPPRPCTRCTSCSFRPPAYQYPQTSTSSQMASFEPPSYEPPYGAPPVYVKTPPPSAPTVHM